MTDRHELLAAFLDDALTESQADELRNWVESDPANLAWFSENVAREELLRDVIVSKESLAEATRPERGPSLVRPSPVQLITTCAIGVCLVGAVLWALIPNAGRSISLTLVRANGKVTVLDAENQRRRLNVGESIPKGNTLVTGDGSRATFADENLGTIALVGASQMSVTESSSNSLRIDHGVMLASIAAQPRHRPFTIRTPSAEATVLGTSFAINADPDQTVLQVNRGNVRFRRLSDSRSLDVNPDQIVRAEASDVHELQAARVVNAPAEWNAAPGISDNARWLGRWSTEHVLTASPRTVFVKEQEIEEEHFHAGISNVYPGFVKLTDESVISVRYRIDRPINLGVFVSTHASSWDFTGNFQAYIEHLKAPPDTAGWRTMAIPIRSFTALAHSGLAFRSGCEVSTIYVTSYAEDVGLEISELRVHLPTE